MLGSCISPVQCSLFWRSEQYTCDTLETIYLHFKTSSSSFQNLLSDRNSAKVKTAQCLCAVPPPVRKDTCSAHCIIKQHLQSLSAEPACMWEHLFFSTFFSSLPCLRPQLSKGKENCPQCSETHAFFVCMVYSNVFMPNEWNIVNVYCIKIKVCNLAVIIQWVTDIIRTSIWHVLLRFVF